MATIKFFWLVLIFQRASCDVLVGDCQCGIPNSGPTSERIIRGQETRINEFPWTVGLFASRFDEFPFCMGTLVSSAHIITAAHCIEASDVRYVSLGDHDVTTRSETKSWFLPVRGYRYLDAIHPDYNNGNGESFPVNDIAIIELRRSFEFSSSVTNVLPLCLPSADLDTDPDKSGDPMWATVAGWGITENHRQSKILKSVDLMVETNDDCDKKYRENGGKIISTHLCAYGVGKDACQGDSGAALFATQDGSGEKHMELIGVVSFGEECAMRDKPGVYTRVSKYVDWIFKRMESTPGDVFVCQGPKSNVYDKS